MGSFEILIRKCMKTNLMETSKFDSSIDKDQKAYLSKFISRNTNINAYIRNPPAFGSIYKHHSSIHHHISNPHFVALSQLPYNLKAAFNDAQCKDRRIFTFNSTQKPFIYYKLKDIHKNKQRDFVRIVKHWMRESEINHMDTNVIKIIVSYHELVKYNMKALKNVHFRYCLYENNYGSDKTN